MSKRIMLGIPVNRWLSPKFSISLSKAVHHLIVGGYTVDINYNNGSILPDQRNKIIHAAADAKMDLLFMDSDMVFDETVVEAVVSAQGDLKGGLCFMRRPPFAPCVFDENKVDEECVFTGKKLSDIPNYPFVCAAVGCAFLHIPLRTIDTILEKYPHPFNHFEMNNGDSLGEDLSFFHRCHLLGLTTTCVPDIEIGHITERIVGRRDHIAALLHQKKVNDEACDENK